MSANLPSGTVTFLFTDIEGSTRLWQAMPQAMASAHARHDAILRSAIETSHGHIFLTAGDAFAAAFHYAVDGLQAALSAQRLLQAEAWGETGAIHVRMGLHTGSAQVSAGGAYEGYTTLAATQRVMSAAHGGQTLLTQATYALLPESLPDGISLRDLGEHWLKDLTTPMRLYQAGGAGLRQNFPPVKSLESHPNNLPTQLTSFIGREKELAEIETSLEISRLVTLTGSGGAGKTRLSIEIGRQALTRFSSGVWIVELAALSDPEQIIPEMAQVFGLQETPSSPLRAVVTDYLREKSLLLILDNCEHLIAACAGLAEQLLQQCAGLKILVSSREVLGITGEMAYYTPALGESESTRLFEERARSANSRFAIGPANAAAVAQICAHLDGIPLAIELAAARTRVLSVEQIAARLDDRFSLLTGGSRTALPRQQTLRALIDWSYDMLSEPERALLRRLSVFTGGWTFDAAESVCPNHDVLELLTQLVNKSLVIVDDGEATRYRLLETIRQYAQEQLRGKDQEADALKRHARYYAQLVSQVAENQAGQALPERLRTVQDDHDNLRAAFEWLLAHDHEPALRMVAQLGTDLNFWELGGFFQEGRRWLQRALEQTDGLVSIQRARALLAASELSSAISDFEYGLQCARQAQDLFQQLTDPPGEIDARLKYCELAVLAGKLTNLHAQAEEALQMAEGIANTAGIAKARGVLGSIAYYAGENQAAIQYVLPSIALWRELERPFDHAAALNRLAGALLEIHEYAAGQKAYLECRDIYQSLGYQRGVALAIHNLGGVAFDLGDYARARALFCDSLRIRHDLGLQRGYAYSFEFIADVDGIEKRYERAVQLLAAAETLRVRIGAPLEQLNQKENEASLTRLRAQLGDVVFELEWSKGAHLTTEQAIALALG